jgi:hypothetical protein
LFGEVRGITTWTRARAYLCVQGGERQAEFVSVLRVAGERLHGSMLCLTSVVERYNRGDNSRHRASTPLPSQGKPPLRLQARLTQPLTPQTQAARTHLVPVHASCLCVAAVRQQCCCRVHQAPHTAVHLAQALTHVCATRQLQ